MHVRGVGTAEQSFTTEARETRWDSYKENT
jgi:hypothetical protein